MSSTIRSSARSSAADSSIAPSSASHFIPDDESHSFDLLPASASCISSRPQLEDHADAVFGAEHLRKILTHPMLLSKFSDFLKHRNTDGLHLLVYYLDVQKAIKAVQYANAIAAGLEPLKGRGFSEVEAQALIPPALSKKADGAFEGLLEELAAFVTQTFVDVTSHNVAKRITGTLRPELKDVVDGLGESFCLTDPSRPDNPIIFMSEEFNRVTQYGVSYVIGKNCRFLQGPRTDKTAIRRLGEATRAGRETSELFINYRRDGSPFMNLLMCAPLRDSNGTVKYFIGAQVDVTAPFLENIGLDSMKDFIEMENELGETERDELRDLVELFNDGEIATAKQYSGRLHCGRKKAPVQMKRANARGRSDQRVMIQDSTPEKEEFPLVENGAPYDESLATGGGLLKGVYENYLLVRPYPSLRILFTSPSLRTPGIHQMPFIDKIGGSERVRNQLFDAMRGGTGVTAKIQWITNRDTDKGRERWAHCTPLLDSTGNVGVWMIVLVDVPSCQMVNVYQSLSSSRNQTLNEYGPQRDSRSRARYRDSLDVYQVEGLQQSNSMRLASPTAEKQFRLAASSSSSSETADKQFHLGPAPCSLMMPITPPPGTPHGDPKLTTDPMGTCIDGDVRGVPRTLAPTQSDSREPRGSRRKRFTKVLEKLSYAGI